MSVKRREFLHALGAFALLPASARSRSQTNARPRFSSDPFTLGVASGYPVPSGFVIWTRLAPVPDEADGGMPPEDVPVHWEVASDEAMRNPAASGVELATGEWVHSVHVEVEGLKPDHFYWYRFRAGDALSRVGRARTAPSPDSEVGRLRFAFASCQHYEQGYFGAYRHMIQDDLDLIVFLGDYIYDTSYGGRRVRSHNAGKANTLSDYRKRHALYKRDADLQAAHAAYTWILTWDDHEVENDYAGDHSYTREPRELTLARRAAAYKAYYEHQPLRRSMRPVGPDALIYTSLEYGRLARFHVLDTRQYRTPQPCQRWGHGGGNYLVDCAERTSPTATMLGAEQERWLAGVLASSRSRWNVLAQQTMVAQLDLSTGPTQSFWTDDWDGYPEPRRRLLECLRELRASNPVFIGGDAHMYWVSELQLDPDSAGSPVVACDFTGTSITSRPLMQSWLLPELLSENRHIKFGDCEHHGYVRVEIDSSRLSADLRVTDRIDTPNVTCSTLASFVVEDGTPCPIRI